MLSNSFEHVAVSRVARKEKPFPRSQNSERAPHGSVSIKESAASPVLRRSKDDFDSSSKRTSDDVSVPPVQLNAICYSDFAHERFNTDRHDPLKVEKKSYESS